MTTNKMAEEGRTPDYTTLVVHRTRCDGKSSFLAFCNSKEWQGQEDKQTTIKMADNLASHGRLTTTSAPRPAVISKFPSSWRKA